MISYLYVGWAMTNLMISRLTKRMLYKIAFFVNKLKDRKQRNKLRIRNFDKLVCENRQIENRRLGELIPNNSMCIIWRPSNHMLM